MRLQLRRTLSTKRKPRISLLITSIPLDHLWTLKETGQCQEVTHSPHKLWCTMRYEWWSTRVLCAGAAFCRRVLFLRAVVAMKPSQQKTDCITTDTRRDRSQKRKKKKKVNANEIENWRKKRVHGGTRTRATAAATVAPLRQTTASSL